MVGVDTSKQSNKQVPFVRVAALPLALPNNCGGANAYIFATALAFQFSLHIVAGRNQLHCLGASPPRRIVDIKLIIDKFRI